MDKFPVPPPRKPQSDLRKLALGGLVPPSLAPSAPAHHAPIEVNDDPIEEEEEEGDAVAPLNARTELPHLRPGRAPAPQIPLPEFNAFWDEKVEVALPSRSVKALLGPPQCMLWTPPCCVCVWLQGRGVQRVHGGPHRPRPDVCARGRLHRLDVVFGGRTAEGQVSAGADTGKLLYTCTPQLCQCRS